MSIWDRTYNEAKERIEQDIADVLLDIKPSIRLRLDEFKTVEFTSAGLWLEINEDEDADKFYLAAHIKQDQSIKASIERRAKKAISHLAETHAELEANDAERQARSETSRVVAFG